MYFHHLNWKHFFFSFMTECHSLDLMILCSFQLNFDKTFVLRMYQGTLFESKKFSSFSLRISFWLNLFSSPPKFTLIQFKGSMLFLLQTYETLRKPPFNLPFLSYLFKSYAMTVSLTINIFLCLLLKYSISSF
jgi:hypothetical protein